MNSPPRSVETAPLVTIAIPSKNNARTIGQTIQSLLNQTHQHWTLTVCDTASDDGTQAIVRSFKDERITLREDNRDLSMRENWQRCVHHAGGEFFQLLCADDVLHPRCLEKKIREAGKPDNTGCVLFTSNRMITSVSGRSLFAIGFSRKARHATRRDVVNHIVVHANPIGDPSTVLIRTVAVAHETRPFTGRLTVDIDFWLRLLEQGNLCHLPETLSYFRMGGVTGTQFWRHYLEYTRFYQTTIKSHFRGAKLLWYYCGYVCALVSYTVRQMLYVVDQAGVQRIIRFGLTGIFNTLVSYTAYVVCVWLGLAYYQALICSQIVGTINNYITFSLFVFADRSRHGTVPLYLVGQVLIYGVSVLSVGTLIRLGLGPYLSGFLALPVIATFSFSFENFVVFRRSRHDTVPGTGKDDDTIAA